MSEESDTSAGPSRGGSGGSRCWLPPSSYDLNGEVDPKTKRRKRKNFLKKIKSIEQCASGNWMRTMLKIEATSVTLKVKRMKPVNYSMANFSLSSEIAQVPVSQPIPWFRFIERPYSASVKAETLNSFLIRLRWISQSLHRVWNSLKLNHSFSCIS